MITSEVPEGTKKTELEGAQRELRGHKRELGRVATLLAFNRAIGSYPNHNSTTTTHNFDNFVVFYWFL